MGFMGLGNWIESDGAADIHFEIEKAVERVIKKSLKDPGNSYNPPGVINLALIFEETPKLADFVSESLMVEIGQALRHADCNDWRHELKKDVRRLKDFWERTF